MNKRKQKKQAMYNESDEQRQNRLLQKRHKAKEAYHDNRSAQRQENCAMKRLQN